jgi:hypothetical protein
LHLIPLLCFTLLGKKLTVIGIIEKTHGVSKAANPDKKSKKYRPQSLWVADLGSATTSFQVEIQYCLYQDSELKNLLYRICFNSSYNSSNSLALQHCSYQV